MKDIDPTSKIPVTAPTTEILGKGAILGNLQNELRTTRKVVMRNKTKLFADGGEYLAPDADALNDVITEGQGKVQYFPVHELSAGQETSGEPGYYRSVIEPLCAKLIEEFPNKNLALRGIMTSVNGMLPDAMGKSKDILDVTDTVRLGNEQNAASFNVQLMSSANAQEAAMSLKYVANYTYRTDMNVRFEIEDPAHQDAIFPAVLVYDASLLQSTGEDRFTATLRDGSTADEALLAAYVLDRPL